MKRYLVERELIQNNIQVLQKKAGSAVIWAVLKGNGYGLGLLPMAETCPRGRSRSLCGDGDRRGPRAARGRL